MKLSDYKGEEAIELLADLMEPISEILDDDKIREAFQTEGTKYAQIVQMLLKRHKRTVLEIMALIDGVPVEEYKPTFFELPIKIIEILKMPEIKLLFTSQGQITEREHSGSVTASIGVLED